MLKNLVRKACYGNRNYSRLHDEKGNKIAYKLLFLHSPKAIMTGLLRIAFGYRPLLPWISYSAIDYLQDFLNKEKTVLEFGSGMSTVWYAQFAKQVASVEDCQPWFQKVKTIFKEKNITNVEYVILTDDAYVGYKSDSGEQFDLIMIDGSNRHHCALNAINLIKEGGIIYLDNSDKHADTLDGDTKLAENVLLDFVKRKKGADVIYFTDFAPTTFFVQQGMLCHFKKTNH
ncbi:class I SAM-dependent methyltransferase [Methylovulum psychrotolerans]|uniref:SAM-dependent methyltransferase n=1 Tax=Methylovulum psychrotolerans TaxID=1704499 RepID=A0A1Z4BWN0_9GAMM|nr:class I SAM-dependent methyltransferase [Methylovulum psychrotolerans]ASF45695.1 hypothetical protein CEK71_06190 [Methylovulum psychrotolerans]